MTEARTRICGTVAPGFDHVRTAFEANFDRGLEVGASCAAYVDGQLVVDLWGGVADEATDRPWRADTLALVYSVTKGVTAVCTSLLVERGELELDRVVSDYWPEFAQAGKQAITVRQLLSHQAGLPVIEGPVSRADLLRGRPLADRLAKQAPLWPPGTRHGYHVLTFGWLAGELVRRITGRSIGRFLEEEVSGPLGADVYIGLPEALAGRVAKLVDGRPAARADVAAAIPDPAFRQMVLSLFDDVADPTSLVTRGGSLNGLLATPDPDCWNDRELQAAEIPAGNAITNARSLARVYAACVGPVDGHSLLSDATIAAVTQEQACGPDHVLKLPMRYGVGFQLDAPSMPMLGPASFGHPGTGGALGFADSDARVGFGYVPSKLAGFGDAPRVVALIDALRQAL